jgi:hypothetical protein
MPTMSKNDPFAYVNAINTKNVGDVDPSTYEASAFLVNRSLSYFTDTLFYANEMNRFSHLSGEQQFCFLLNTVRKGKRFSKWAKAEVNDDVNLISSFYQVNQRRAREILNILTDEQLATIKEKSSLGGKA